MAGVSIGARITVRDKVRGWVKVINYSLIAALPVASSTDPHIHFLPMAEKFSEGFFYIMFLIVLVHTVLINSNL